SPGDRDPSKHPGAILFLFRTIGPINVYVVDGIEARKMDLDFTTGGNSGRYPWIGPNTIWIDNDNSAEFAFTLLHELTEYNWMMRGLGYDPAHERANAVEWRARVNPHEYDALLAEQEQKLLGNSGSLPLAGVRKKIS